MRELDAVRRMPPTSLDRVVGTGRRLRVVSGRLDLVRDVAHAHGGARVNDAPLAAVAGGLRALLLSRGEDVHDLPPALAQRARHAPAPPRRGRPATRGRHDVRAVPASGSRRRRRAAPPGWRWLLLAASSTSSRPRWGRAQLQPGRPPAHDAFRGAAALGRRVRGQHPRSTGAAVLGRARRYSRVVPGRAALPRTPCPSGVGALSYAGCLGITVVVHRYGCPDIQTSPTAARALTELEHEAARPRTCRRRLGREERTPMS